jgi:hypothetical protein
MSSSSAVVDYKIDARNLSLETFVVQDRYGGDRNAYETDVASGTVQRPRSLGDVVDLNKILADRHNDFSIEEKTSEPGIWEGWGSGQWTNSLDSHPWELLSQCGATVQIFALTDEQDLWLDYWVAGVDVGTGTDSHGIWRRLAKECEPLAEQVRVASGLETSPEQLDVLAKKAERRVQMVVAGNPNSTAETLQWLAANADDQEVFAALADNPECPAKVIHLLALNCPPDATSLREALAVHPACGEETRVVLALR